MEKAIAEEEERNQRPVPVETKSKRRQTEMPKAHEIDLMAKNLGVATAFANGKEEPDQEKSEINRQKTEELVLSQIEDDEDEF